MTTLSLMVKQPVAITEVDLFSDSVHDVIWGIREKGAKYKSRIEVLPMGLKE
jgi:hypothetical protein